MKLTRLGLVLAMTALFLGGGAGAQEQESVDSAELQKASGNIEFISNTARPDQVDTRAQIFNLGNNPGLAIRAGAETAGPRSRYFVIHRLYPPELDKLDADIFGLGTTTSVDTITNLRLIIQGYLEAAYAYTATDAALLAEYVTIYNAVYRQNRTYFTQRYKAPLLNDLTTGSEGIALHFREWPGRTMMLIPLMSARAGSLSAIDTTVITDPSVIDKMRENADRGIDSRQGMVNLKEREAEAADEAAAQQRRANAAEEQRIAEERNRVAQEQQQLAAEKARIEEAQKSATAAADKAALDKQAAEIAERENTLAQSEKQLDNRADELEQNKEATRETEAFAERKAAEAERDRQSIAADQRQIITGLAQAPANAPAESGILAVKLGNSSSSRGTLLKINPASGNTLRTSALSQVSGRSLTNVGGKTIVLATSGGKTRLVEIDTTTLQSLNQSTEELNVDTQIWVSGNNLYALVLTGGKNYIARFNAGLQKQAQSTRTIHPWASLWFQGDKIITQNDRGAVIILNANDLTE